MLHLFVVSGSSRPAGVTTGIALMFSPCAIPRSRARFCSACTVSKCNLSCGRCGALFPLRRVTRHSQLRITANHTVLIAGSLSSAGASSIRRQRQFFCSGPYDGRCVNAMTVSEAGISLAAPCWADPALHCLPAILRTEQVKPASHGCSQIV